jgi:hypothetical protein
MIGRHNQEENRGSFDAGGDCRTSRPEGLAADDRFVYNLFLWSKHRMEKARRAGLEYIMAYKVRMEEYIRFLTTFKGYSAFVEYWNGKLKDMRDDGI